MSKPIGAAGLALSKCFEGCRLTAYKPVSTEGQVVTQAEAGAVDNPA